MLKKISMMAITIFAAGTINIQAQSTGVSLVGIIHTAIEDKTFGDSVVVDLDKNTPYVLDGAAHVGLVTLAINGNGAKVTFTDDSAQIVVKQGLFINNLNFDCGQGTLAPIAMEDKANLTLLDTLCLYSEVIVGLDTTVTEQGDTTITPIKEMLFPNAANKVFLDTVGISLDKCNFSDLKNSFISGGNAPWALRDLVINECIFQFDSTYAGGKAVLNWEEGASQIKNIKITNSTFYCLSENTTQRFHRYTGQVDPWRVWGYTEESGGKNAPGINTWTFENNTFMNLCGNKEFSNNIKNTAATTFVFKNNIFWNCWRLQKLGSNVTRDFEAADNSIKGGVNAVDLVDMSKWATEDTLMGMTTPKTKLDLDNIGELKDYLQPYPFSYTNMNELGDSRWLTEPLLNVVVTEVGYATLFCLDPVTVPAGVTVYPCHYNPTVNAIVPDTTLTEGAVIPGKQGYLIKADPGDYTFEISEDTPVSCQSELEGVIVKTDVSKSESSVHFVLHNGTNGVGFYPVPYDGVTKKYYMSAFKAYILISSSENGSVELSNMSD